MRTIKFRAWDVRKKGWCNEDDYNLFIGLDGDLEFHNYGYPTESLRPDCHPKIKLMQFTGLKDKNGKEIYEGDIVNRFEDYNFKVVWCEEDGAFVLRSLKDKNDDYFRHMKYYELETEIEVIGNIYENPELIKNDLKRRKKE